MFKLAFRNVFRHVGRTSLTLLVIVLGVSGLILSGGFVNDIFIQLREVTIHSRLGHVQVHKKGYLERGRQTPNAFLIESKQSPAEQLAADERTDGVLSRLAFSGLLTVKGADLPIIGEGVEAAKEQEFGTAVQMVKGQALGDEDVFGIILGEGVAAALKAVPGTVVTLLANTTDGALNSVELTVIGVFRTFSKDFDDRAVRIQLDTARDLMLTTGAHSIVVYLKQTNDTEGFVSTYAQSLGNKDFEATPWIDLADFYRSTVELYRTQFGVLEIIILAMIILGVANTVNMAVFERTGEFGTMRALGNRSADIFRLVVTENIILGLLGAALGVVLGLLLAEFISRIGIPMPPPPNSNSAYVARVQPGIQELLGSFFVGFVGTVVASLLSARTASKIPILDALRRNI